MEGKTSNSATRHASASELLSKLIPLARAVAMQEATTKAEEEETPAAGGTVPLMAILRRRGGLCWIGREREKQIRLCRSGRKLLCTRIGSRETSCGPDPWVPWGRWEGCWMRISDSRGLDTEKDSTTL